MNAILHLIDYAVEKHLIDESERVWATNSAKMYSPRFRIMLFAYF